MKKKLRIALLVSNLDVGYHDYEVIEKLFNDNDIDLQILNSSIPNTAKGSLFTNLINKIRTQGLLKTIQKVLFQIQSILERYALRFLIDKEDRKYFNIQSLHQLGELNSTQITGKYSKSGLVVRYSDEDIQVIKNLNLDLILRVNTPGIFRGGILSASKHGMISFHHGNNRWNRGGPPGFWEVYYQKPATGFIIQILSEELDGGKVIFRGEIPTSFFYELNKFRLYKESYPFMYLAIKRFIEKGSFDFEEEQLFSDRLYKHPNLVQLLIYQYRLVKFVIPKSIRVIFKWYPKWSVHFIQGNYNNIQLRKAKKIKNPKGRFFADPFVVNFKGKHILYVEDYEISKEKAIITAIELNGKDYTILGTAIEEDFHLSYPFLFTYKDELFMIPESYNVNAIRLYKCIDYPLKWEYQKDLISNINCADTNIFEHDGKWWLLTNMFGPSSLHSSQLNCYYTDDPISGTWKEHSNNPILYQNKARNGGWLEGTESLIRVSQKYGYDAYGVSIVFSKIGELTEHSYSEDEGVEILPNFDKGIKGFHHMNDNGSYTVFDVLK